MVTSEDARQQYWNELSEASAAMRRNLSKIKRSPGRLQGDVVEGGRLYGEDFMIVTYPELQPRDDPLLVEGIDSSLALISWQTWRPSSPYSNTSGTGGT